MKFKTNAEKKSFRMGIALGAKRMKEKFGILPKKHKKKSAIKQKVKKNPKERFNVVRKGVVDAEMILAKDMVKRRDLSHFGYAFDDNGNELSIQKDPKGQYFAAYSYDLEAE